MNASETPEDPRGLADALATLTKVVRDVLRRLPTKLNQSEDQTLRATSPRFATPVTMTSSIERRFDEWQKGSPSTPVI